MRASRLAGAAKELQRIHSFEIPADDQDSSSSENGIAGDDSPLSLKKWQRDRETPETPM
jgi:hypothetical protein